MSTISKINVGSKDYDIIDSGLRGLGTSIGSSDDLNNLVTPDTRFYFNGSGTAPKNSPTSSAYSLTVKSAPNGTDGCVVQTASASGAIIYERERTYSGGSYSWGAWASIGAEYADTGGYDNGDLYYRRIGKFVVFQLDATVSAGYTEITWFPRDCIPAYNVDFVAPVYKESSGGLSISQVGLCNVDISKTSGKVSASMVPSGGGRLTISSFFVAAN